MKTVGIAIDTWKLPVFKRHLEASGYAYTKYPGLTADTLFLKVKADFVAPLQKVIEAAQKECKSQ